jgi:predicted ATPase/DNA-binding SARP family transcriptional activator
LEELKLELLLLGPLQISLAGEPLSGLVSLKAKALLAYLAVERHPIPRSTLAGLLWSNLPEEEARRNLRVEISKLRRSLGPFLNFTHQDAIFKAGAPCRIDLYELEGHLAAVQGGAAAASLSKLTEVFNLYRGDFLSGLHMRGAPLFEEWLVLERERMRQAVLVLLDRLVETAIRQGDWQSGLRAARKSLAVDNWREYSHHQLIHLLALSGDRPAALAQFEATRRTLVQELGIEPGPETLELYQRIKAGDFTPSSTQEPAPASAVLPLPHNLPAPTTSFIGRETELDQLGELFSNPSCRLVTLTGPGGMGKTRLAVEFCWKLTCAEEAPFKDGIYIVHLSAVQSGDLLHTALADALKLPGAPDPRQQLMDYLSSRQMLLLLDNFEQLAEVAHLLVELLQGAPGIRLLVTSRHHLNLYEEWIFPLEGMSYPMQGDISGWKNYAAVQLFQQRAQRVNLRFSVEDNRDCIVRLCQLLEGLPLGIELVAALVNLLPCQNILQLIEKNLALPDQQVRNLPARQRSMQAVFQYSWDLLSTEEQICLSHLTVFQRGFTVEAAESTLGVSPRLLASLVAKSLLRFSTEGRYEMHSLLRSYVSEKLSPADQQKAQAAHSAYFGQFLTARSQQFAGPEEARAIAAIRADITNIRLGWHWVLAQIPGAPVEVEKPLSERVIELLAQYIPTLSTFYFRKSWFREAEPLFSEAVDRAEAAGFASLPPASRAPFVLGMLYLARARHCRALGQNQTARTMVLSALRLLAQYDDSAEISDAWHILGQIEQQTGDLVAADEAYQHSLRIYRSLEQPTGIASNLISLGVLAKNRGDLIQATVLYTECLEIFQQRGDQRGIWTCLINLGNIANVRQDYEAAKQRYNQAYTNVQHSGDKSRQALTLLNLGSVAREVDETGQALEYYSDSLRISQEIGEVRIKAASLDGLGKTCLNQGDLETARGYLLRALQNAYNSNLLPQALDSLTALARLMVKRQQLPQAVGILAFVLVQPSCPSHVRQEAEREIGIIKTQVPADVVTGIAQEFQELPLAVVISRLKTPEFVG